MLDTLNKSINPKCFPDILTNVTIKNPYLNLNKRQICHTWPGNLLTCIQPQFYHYFDLKKCRKSSQKSKQFEQIKSSLFNFGIQSASKFVLKLSGGRIQAIQPQSQNFAQKRKDNGKANAIQTKDNEDDCVIFRNNKVLINYLGAVCKIK